jgi:CO dehydrogenase maturation factor
MKIAVAGKGGVGKTFLAGSLARHWAATGRLVLAIDADPAPNLALMLGLTVEEAALIVPVSDNRELIDQKTKTPYPSVFNISFPVDDIIRDYTIPTPSGANLMVVGTVKQWGSGCACPSSTVIRTLLSRLVTTAKDIVILDLEAGLEHLGRATTGHVDILLIVTDAAPGSLMVAGRICDLTENSGIRTVMIAGNRITGESDRAVIRTFARERGLRVAGMIPYDSGVQASDPAGDTPACRAVSELASMLEAEVAK